MSFIPQLPHTWSQEHLYKLAFLEKKAINYLDEFIDSQISKGENSVALKRFPGHVSHAHEYNLRDYIGRSESLIFDFLCHRQYLWSVNCNGFIIKCTDRENLHEMAILMDENVKKKGQPTTKVRFLLAKTSPRYQNGTEIKSMLLQYPEVFKAIDIDIPEEETEFEFLLTIINRVILPKSITSKFGSGVVKALAATPSIKSAPDLGSVSDDQMEGVGRVIHVVGSYGFLNCHKDGHSTKIFFDSRALGVPPSTVVSDHVKEGDQLSFKAIINQTGPQVGKWCAVSVRNHSLIPATKPKSSASASKENGGEKLDKRSEKNVGVDLNLEAMSKKVHRPKAEVRNLPQVSVIDYVSDQESISHQSNETDIQVGDLGDQLEYQPASNIEHVDVGVQTDLTDEEILLRLLSSFPNLLDEYQIARQQ